MPTNGHEGHDMGKPEGVHAHPAYERDAEHPGYETQDVNVGGIITFLAGLTGFVVVFFIFCFFMGKLINTTLVDHDGSASKFKANLSQPGATPRGDKRQDLASNAELEQRQLAAVAKAFPTPTLETDDGNQDTADLHAREDLLLNYTSTSKDLPAGTVRIPIAQAMEMIVKQGLPKQAGTPAAKKLMAGERDYTIHAPLTDGFARTGYELDTMESRKQRMEVDTEAKKD